MKPLSLALLLILSTPGRAGAEEVLGLSQAITTAQQNSLAVATSESKLLQARTQIDQTYSGLYPQLSLSTNGSSNRQIDSGALPSLGGGGSLASLAALFGGAGGGASNMIQTSLSVSQVLFDGFQTADALRLADASVKMSEVDRSNQWRKAGYDAANSYMQVLRAQGLYEVSLKSVSQARAHVETARLREHAGTGTRFEVLQAESQLANVQGQLRSAMNGVELARLALGNALGEPLGNRTLAQAVSLPSLEFNLESELSPALENRPELQTLLLKRRMDEANLDLNRKANYPKAQAQAQYSQQGLGTGRSLMVAAGLTWTLVDWGKADAKVSASRQDLRQTDLNLELTRRVLASDIQSALFSRQDARDRLLIAQKGLQVSQETFHMAQIRYNAGVGTGYDVIDAQAMLVQAQNNYVQANYDVQSAEIRLAQALGMDLGQVLAQKRS